MSYTAVPDHTGQSFPASPQYATIPGTSVGVPVAPQYQTVPSGATAVTPATIFANIIEYLDGDEGVNVGTGEWTGQVAGSVWTPNGAPTYSATLLNGHGGFSYVRASSQRHANATLDLPVPPFSIIAVVRQNAWNSGATLIGASSTTARIFQNSATPQIAQTNGATVNSNGNLALSTWGVVIADYASGANGRVRAGGVDVSTGDAGGGNPAATLQIAAVGGAGHMSMSLVQLVLVSTYSAGEMTDYAAYVLSRYGVTL